MKFASKHPMIPGTFKFKWKGTSRADSGGERHRAASQWGSARPATYEMAQRGIHYLLIHDSDPIAEDIRDDPDGWGLTEIASGYGVRLYQCCKP